MKDNYYEEDFNKNIKKLTNIRKNNKSSLVKNKKKWYNILAKMYEVLGVVHTYSLYPPEGSEISDVKEKCIDKMYEILGSYMPIPVVQLRGRKYQMASEKMYYRLNLSVDQSLGEVSN